jgi:hypothetical protein
VGQYRAPNANAHIERWIRGAREECFSHLVFFGLNSLRRAVGEYGRFFNHDRPHQGIGNGVPAAVDDEAAAGVGKENGRLGAVHCDGYLGGLLKSYRRAA